MLCGESFDSFGFDLDDGSYSPDPNETEWPAEFTDVSNM